MAEESVNPNNPHEFERDPEASDPRFPELCKTCGYSKRTTQVRHTEPVSRPSSIQLYKHEYADGCFVLAHFTGEILVGEEDLHEIYRQLDQHLYPNKGFESELPVRTYPEKEQ